jgi:zinc D-Ala-D-Ala carboxypeptidase
MTEMTEMAHYSLFPRKGWPWPNFPPDEPYLACPCCGELWLHKESMHRLQRARDLLGRPMRLNSGHRCAIHNARVGGAPLSQHKLIAFDVSLHGHDRQAVLAALLQAGFGSFGFYATFIHTDVRPGRRWFGPISAREKERWNSVISSM